MGYKDSYMHCTWSSLKIGWNLGLSLHSYCPFKELETRLLITSTCLFSRRGWLLISRNLGCLVCPMSVLCSPGRWYIMESARHSMMGLKGCVCYEVQGILKIHIKSSPKGVFWQQIMQAAKRFGLEPSYAKQPVAELLQEGLWNCLWC